MSERIASTRRAGIAALALLLGGASPLPAISAASATVIACDQRPSVAEQRTLTCSLGVADSPRYFRLTARFAGSHDDSTVSLALRLGGQAVRCDPGSVTELSGEYGEVTLRCVFGVKGGGDGGEMLNVDVVHTHAQLIEVELAVVDRAP